MEVINLNGKFLSAPKYGKQRKNLEASLIAIIGPSLNNQLETKSSNLFRNGVT